MSHPASPYNPLIEKRNAAAETLNRRRRTLSEFSVKLAEERHAFFDRLALLAAGALTFSVTLIAHPVPPHALRLFILYGAWIALLIGLGGCLVRNYTNQSHRFFSVGSNRAESEVALIDADTETVTAMAPLIKYEDATEPFDKERELRINKENRDVWQAEFERTKRKAELHWKFAEFAERAAIICVIVGFLLLIIFAVVNTYRQPDGGAGQVHTSFLRGL
jgi:hypothetical protein